MKESLPTRTLRDHPDLDQLKRQAKELLRAFAEGEPHAVREVHAHSRGAGREPFALHDAQLVIARAYGFDSWLKLKAYVDGANVARLAQSVQANNLEQVRAILRVRPELVNMETEENEQRPIHYAVYNRSSEMVRLLMAHGANARKGIWPNRDATSAFTIASERGYDEMAAIIEAEERRRPDTRRQGDDRGRPWPAELEQAARRGDEETILAFFERDPWLPQSNEYLLTPLHRAVTNLWERVAAWLLDHGADVNARIDGGPSPLEIVGCGFGPGQLGDLEKVARIAAMLRARGAAMTPRAAVAHGESEWLRARHGEGKLVNELHKNQGHRGLLEIAVFHNRPEMLELLLDLGFDPDEPVRKGESEEYARGGPLLCCVRLGRVGMAETLLARGATLTPWAAVLLGKGEWLRERHAAGRLDNPIGPEGGLISMAVKHDRPDMLAVLLELGFDPDERVRVEGLEEPVYSSGGPLRECAKRAELEMAKLLLDGGADPNGRVYGAGSAVFVAYRKKNEQMVKLLESRGGRLSAASAGYVRQTEIARKMLAGEVDARLEEGTGFNTVTVAEQLLWSGAGGGDPEIVRTALEKIDWLRDDPKWFWILWRPLPGHEPWAKEDRELFIECFRLILGRCDPNLRAERYGQTMLHEAIARDHEDKSVLARMLLDAGARMDIRDDLLKSTPLGWACRWGRVESVRLLLKRGAHAVEADAEDWATPRAWAEKRKHRESLALLAEYGG